MEIWPKGWLRIAERMEISDPESHTIDRATRSIERGEVDKIIGDRGSSGT
jgi:hypothetical protein